MPLYPKWAIWINNFIKWLIAWFLGLRVDNVEPRKGWPGSILTLVGHGFSANRDENQVTIGGVQALIIEAEANRLLVLAGETTASGAISVKVGAKSSAAGQFEVLAYPDPADHTQPGAPRFFHGPQHGTPQTNVANQRVLVLFAFPPDHDPGAPAARTVLRNAEIAGFDDARRFWNEASYGSTTWAMTYSNWFALPQNRRAYFWEQGDVDDARLKLLRLSARPLVRSGSSLIHGQLTGWVPIDHPGPLNWNYGLGPASLGSPVLSLKRVGNRLYAGTEAGVLAIYDVTNPSAATLLGSVPATASPAPIWGIEVVGTVAVLAIGPLGFGTVDVSNPAAPSVLFGGGAPDSEWGTVVRAVGSRIYGGRGMHLRIMDLVGTNLNVVADINVGPWITDIAVDGATCAVATDGGGLKLF
ncbi:MAG TPA: IPT/TIG domain-containing protein, partial [Phenylobacterium sp.]